MAGGIGATVEARGRLSHAFFFGEDQGRYVVTAPPSGKRGAIAEEAKRLNVPLSRIGVTGGETLKLGGAAPLALAALSEAYENWLPRLYEPSSGGKPMIPFIIVKTVKGFAYIRPERVVAINASDADGLHDPHDRRGHDRRLRARRGCRGAARNGGRRRGRTPLEVIKERNAHGHVANRD